MAVVDQRPGYLAHAFRRGDTFTATVDFNFDVTGYTWEAAIRSTVTGSPLETFTVTVTNAAGGVLQLSLSAAETGEIPAGVYGWTLVGTNAGTVRTYLSGFVEVSE